MNTEIIGLFAATLTTLCSLPQIIQIWKSKDVDAISLPCYLMLWSGITLWFTYGVIEFDMPMMIGNGLSVLCISFIIFCKIRYQAKDVSMQDFSYS